MHFKVSYSTHRPINKLACAVKTYAPAHKHAWTSKEAYVVRATAVCLMPVFISYLFPRWTACNISCERALMNSARISNPINKVFFWCSVLCK